MRELDTTYESWSKKRLIIGLLLIFTLVVLGVIVKESVIKDKSIISLLPKFQKSTVAGISTKKDEAENSSKNLDEESNGNNSGINSLKLKNNIQERLDSIKKEFSNLNATDIASSSPQFKKIIEDIQDLKDLPKNQAKEACYSICRGI